METKKCPIALVGKESWFKFYVTCGGEECAWYDKRCEQCAIMTLALSADSIDENGLHADVTVIK